MRQFKAEGLRDDLFAGTPDTFFIKYLLTKAASCKDFGILVIDISVAFMHARTDEEIYVKVPSVIKSSRFWRLKAAVNGTRKASKHWQEYFSDKLVTNMLFQRLVESFVQVIPFLCVERRREEWKRETKGERGERREERGEKREKRR